MTAIKSKAMFKLKSILINNIILIILSLSLILVLFFAYSYLLRPIFMPRPDVFLLQTKKVQVKKELFGEVISNLEQRSEKAQNALNKFHPDLFRL